MILCRYLRLLETISPSQHAIHSYSAEIITFQSKYQQPKQ